MNFNICIASLLILTSVSALAKYDYDGKNPPPVRKIEAQPAKRPEPLRPAVTPEQPREEIISSTPSATRRSGAPHPGSQYTVLMNGGNGGAAPATAPARTQMTFCQFLNDLFENKKQFRAINSYVDLIPTQSLNQSAASQMGQASNFFSLYALTEIRSQTNDPTADQMIFFNAYTGFFHTIGNAPQGSRTAPLHVYSNPGQIEITDINTFKGVETFPAVAKSSRGILCNRFGVTKL